MDRKPTCDAYYGTGEPGHAICGRHEGHPPISDDGIGHAPERTPDEKDIDLALMLDLPVETIRLANKPLPMPIADAIRTLNPEGDR